ncbi:MAG: hypothetical protein WCP16_25135, partial [Pseudanabaena sp. ELA645]
VFEAEAIAPELELVDETEAIAPEPEPVFEAEAIAPQEISVVETQEILVVEAESIAPEETPVVKFLPKSKNAKSSTKSGKGFNKPKDETKKKSKPKN